MTVPVFQPGPRSVTETRRPCAAFEGNGEAVDGLGWLVRWDVITPPIVATASSEAGGRPSRPEAGMQAEGPKTGRVRKMPLG